MTKSEVLISKPKVGTNQIIRLLVLLALAIFIVSMWGAWHYVVSSPKHVFKSMLAHSLSTTGVVRHVVDDSSSQQTNQLTYLKNVGQHRAQSNSRLTQQGNPPTVIDTESIGTPTSDYARYVKIQTTQKKTDGKSIDFKDILNVWGKSPEDSSGKTKGQLYNQSALGIVPIGNLPASARKALLKQMEQTNVYTTDYQKVEKRTVSGRPTYTYTVQLKPQAYVEMLKNFAAGIGLNQLKDIDTSTYKDVKPIEVRLTVDVLSQQLVQVVNTSSSQIETLTSFGLQKLIQIPQQSIDVEALQQKLQGLQ